MTVAVEGDRMARRSSGPIVAGVLLLAIGAGLAFWGISTRAHALATVSRETRELAVPVVAVIHPDRGAPQQEIVLPGTTQAYIDAPIYARTAGYLKQRYVDIGTRVRAGQLLAEIETPELDQQLEQGRADLGTAEANGRLAQTTAARYRDLIRTNSVSQQDVDNANGSLEARQAAVESARANVKRLEQLQAFRRIVAPFAGVITVRNTEVGALIDSGGNARELFHVAAVDRLRVLVNVPEIYSMAVQNVESAVLTLTELPGQEFTGKLARTSRSIDVPSRTLLAEIDVDNSKGQLLPGSYAQVHFKLPTEASALRVPVSAVMFGSDGVRVAVVKNGSRVVLTPVIIGRDFGNSVEIVGGLSADDQVVLNPSDSLDTGQTVRSVAPAKTAAGGEASR